MNLVPLVQAADLGELILVDGGMCHYHLRRDGVVTIREVLVLPERRRQGIRFSLVAEVVRRCPGRVVRAKCPADWESNSFWAALGFEDNGEVGAVRVWEYRP